MVPIAKMMLVMQDAKYKIMKITETKITDAQLDIVTEVIVSEDAKINLDAEDVRKIVTGRTGVMYEAQQEGKERAEFMTGVFEALAAKPQVKGCTHMLISLEEDQNDKLSMMDMMAVNDFVGSLGEGIELLWGVKPSTSAPGMAIRVVCMK